MKYLQTTLLGLVKEVDFWKMIKQLNPNDTTFPALAFENAMDVSGVWGTELEILAAATMLQAPVYTYTQINSKSYRWLRDLPLSPAHSVTCKYHDSVQRLVHMIKPTGYHLELFHFNSSHYDVIVADNEDSRLSFPPLSNF